MRGKVLTLLVGVALGMLATLPVTALASHWPEPAAGAGGMMHQMMPAAAPTPEGGHAAPGEGQEQSGAHRRMHETMNAMMGEGFSERMHEAIPGGEEMMGQCVSMMDMMSGMMGQGMRGMMEGGTSPTADGMP